MNIMTYANPNKATNISKNFVTISRIASHHIEQRKTINFFIAKPPAY